ncbi:MAG: prepilin-type N-terminal cleavage/methylation domain-containing protein [Bdellovibrionales bacterium]|nr:prepilin-type N-terminal cleavage/methylation domain-containing protein [Bdellovibrionales bacterium]
MNERGFTLMETMIAMAITVFVFTSILLVESASLSALEKARRMNVVAMLSQRAMAEAEMEFEGKPFKEVPKKKEGRFKAPYEDYAWGREIREVEFPNLLGGAISSGSSSEDGEADKSQMADMMGKIMTNYLSKAVREVVVTVSWEKSGASQSFAVSTYWVDLNSEFNLNP